jgi:RNA polymerase sigma factor (sigma-70 family)
MGNGGAQRKQPALVAGLGPEDYHSAFRRLRAFFMARHVGWDDAADLAQETIARALVHIGRHGVAREDLWPLLRTIAHNLYADRGRRSTVAHVPLASAAGVPDERPGPDEVFATRESVARMRSAIAALPHRYRRALDLSMRGHAPAAIARELGIKPNAAYVVLHRARRRLAAHLESDSPLPAVIGAPFALRFRLLLRRLAAHLGRLEPTGAFAAAATSAVAIAAAAALTLAPIGGTHQGRSEALPASPGHIVSVHGEFPVSEVVAGRETATRATGSTPPAEVGASVSNQSVHAKVKDPVGGGDNSGEIDVWHQRDPGHRGVVGPVLDEATSDFCGDASAACAQPVGR